MASPCPTPQTLERMMEGSLVEPHQTHVEGHVERCPICQKTLHHLAGNGAEDIRGLRRMLEHAATMAESFLGRLTRSVPPSRAADDHPSIEGYDVFEEIGRGATSVVYRARQREFDRPVALKVMRGGPHLPPEMRQRFRLEARAIARLDHPNIAKLYDAGEHAGSPYLALELVQGFNLAQWAGGSPLPPRQAATIVATLADAIQYAHEQGVVHRDLKPANILVADSADPGTTALDVKITDFGVAKLISSGGNDTALTLSGAVLGTPAYAAPEQARGEPSDVGPSADIYALGAILYELLTGRPSFQGRSPVETLLQVVHDEPTPPSRFVAGMPRDLETICLTCLEKSPARRYATAADLAADLRRNLRRERIRARRVGTIRRTIRLARRGLTSAAAVSL